MVRTYGFISREIVDIYANGSSRGSIWYPVLFTLLFTRYNTRNSALIMKIRKCLSAICRLANFLTARISEREIPFLLFEVLEHDSPATVG